MKLISFLLLLSSACWAQGALTLREAVKTALTKHPSLDSAAARVRAAEARIAQARGGWLPKVAYQESFQRSNNPVFVFSSLLTQRQFTESNFALRELNRPGFLNNYQSQLSVDQVVYDARQVETQVKSAKLGRTMDVEEQRAVEMSVIAGVVRTYYGSVLASRGLEVARNAVKSAEADLERAESVFASGMATQADVLSIRVHLAGMKEQEIRRSYDSQVADAALNEAMGLPLDTQNELTTPLTELPATDAKLADFEKHADEHRPEIRQAGLAMRLAETQVGGAKASLWPQIGVRGVFEADRQDFFHKGGTNWFVGGFLRWNLFNGLSDRARIDEAFFNLASARKQQEQVDRGVQLQVRKAWADLQASRERVEVASAAVTEAEESLRIIKNRYDSGLTTITELLRNETAVLEASTRRLTALYDVRAAAAALEQAAGVLTGDSDVLK